MQRLFKPTAATSVSTRPLPVTDTATLARVAGGAGPHGGWLVPMTDAPSGALRSMAGPHGGWSVPTAGPHGGW